ncbi:MAG: HemK2/MTQ2 family protein methyltransferase [Thermoplasmata archaeon]
MTGLHRSRPASGAARIYPPREDTFLLLPFTRVRAGSTLLEIGTGNGLLALTAARRGARVVATDVNRSALRELHQRAIEEQLDLQVLRSDLARGLGRFDRILCNPPYLPTPEGFIDPDPELRPALDGGPDGLRLTRRLLPELSRHLGRGAAAFVLFSSLQSPEGTARLRSEWRAAGGRSRTVAARELPGERLTVLRLDPSSVNR